MADKPQYPERREKAKEYAKKRRRLFLIELGFGTFFLVILLLGDLSVRLRELLDFPKPAAIALYFAIIALGYALLTAPLSFYGGFILPRHYGLSRQTLPAWSIDRLKGGLLALIIGIGMIEVVYWLLDRFPAYWWLLAAVFVITVSVVMANLAPIVLLPIFYKLMPVDDPELAQRMGRLAEKAGTRVRGIFVINLSRKMATANAALMGLGNTRRIVLGDTLLSHYSPEEIEVILAHELGHHAHGDIPKMLLAQSAMTLAGFYLANIVLRGTLVPLGFQGIADVAAFPLLMLVIGGFAMLVGPLERAYSRNIERAADEYALSMTDNPQAFISAMTKLAHQNLAEADPGRLVELVFYDHPPYQKRVEHARRYAAARSQTPFDPSVSY